MLKYSKLLIGCFTFGELVAQEQQDNLQQYVQWLRSPGTWGGNLKIQFSFTYWPVRVGIYVKERSGYRLWDWIGNENVT